MQWWNSLGRGRFPCSRETWERRRDPWGCASPPRGCPSVASAWRRSRWRSAGAASSPPSRKFLFFFADNKKEWNWLNSTIMKSTAYHGQGHPGVQGRRRWPGLFRCHQCSAGSFGWGSPCAGVPILAHYTKECIIKLHGLFSERPSYIMLEGTCSCGKFQP